MIRFFSQMTGRLGSNIYAGVPVSANPQQLSFLRQLQKEMKNKDVLDCPLDKLQVTVFDLETTGFYPEKGDAIISIGAVKVTGSLIKENEVFYSLVNPHRTIPEEVSLLTKINDGMLQTAPDEAEVLLKFLDFIGSNVLVAHHAKHEEAFMKKAYRSLLPFKFDRRIIDTSFLRRIHHPFAPSKPLEKICEEYGFETNNRHHALADAKMAARLWSHDLRMAEEKGYKNLREVYEYLSRLR
ncbi:3'-5' exonuclease [Mesobacillus subterraneus]|uniref:3'-5' exonuclease n=2 Tax=Mesobacillus subterraneus TaxID=285983 RepID=A0A3R9DSF7_9BACI|nr:3'-5' exonuclease [Mesobacillus subterraneus]